MYEPIKRLVVELLKAPSGAPEPASGSYASVRVFRASPRYLTYRLILLYILSAVLLVALAIALAASLASGQLIAVIVVLAVALPLFAILVIAWFVVRIDFDLRYYVVTDRSLRVREGAWTVKEMTLTYANVQNLNIVQGPLQRAFGISDVRVDTAGGGSGGKGHDAHATGHQVTLAGIDDPREVRDLILGYVRRFHRGSGLGDPDDPEQGGRRIDRQPAASRDLIDALIEVREAAAHLRLASERRDA